MTCVNQQLHHHSVPPLQDMQTASFCFQLGVVIDLNLLVTTYSVLPYTLPFHHSGSNANKCILLITVDH